MNADTLIIGAGPTGLGAAIRLHAHRRDWLLLEASDHFGGLAASIVDGKGFTWDMGGHVQFSHYDTFDRFMELALGADGWLTHQRESWVWMRKRFVPYPFQNNLHRLDPGDRWACVEGLLEAWQRQEQARVNGYRLLGDCIPDNREPITNNPSASPPPENFEQWMLATFGPGITELFMYPYNFKVWAYPPPTMDYHWIGERVAVPKLGSVLKSICTGQDEVSWGPNRVFRFPRNGGTGAIWNAIGRMLPTDRCRLNMEAVEVVPEEKCVITRSGEKIHYRHLISTAPLNKLIELTRGRVVPLPDAGRLVYSGTNIIGVGLHGQPPEHLRTKCWMYFPENNSPYYRVTVFSNYSPNNVPRPGEQWSLMTETAESPMLPVRHDSLEEETLLAMEEDGLISDRNAICNVARFRLPQGYPTPFLGRDAVVDPMLRAFEAKDIYSRGRFGAWKYEVANQDHSFAQGYECAERVTQGGGPDLEPTLHTPSVVNGRRNP